MPLALANACTPRASVHDVTRRDTVLSIDDLIKDRIDPAEFFAENYFTEGMKTLTQQAFSRLEGKGDQGIFLLKQAMGGGKTHNLLMLGLLAKHPEFRAQFNSVYNFNPGTGPIKVIAFNGRETDHPLGFWGALAEQLGKRENFKDHYSPLRAPGQTAWQNLFKGERVLVMIDELPPYLHAAHATSVGASNLAEVTQTALSNLLSALSSEECSGVCFILTDLEAAYGEDSALIAGILNTLTQETNRSAMPIDPVRMTSDELYHILRKRLFETLPNENDIRDVAQAYAEAIRKANQMDVTTERPEEFAVRVAESYPFHPAMRDLYARFKENPGFQQTRGMIRLMRANVSKLWTSNKAASIYLIGAQHFDLSDEQVKSQIDTINSSLENGIAHDFYNETNDSVAQKIDRDLGNSDATDTAKLIFMSSLSKATHGLIGLNLSEVLLNLAEPGRDLSRLKAEALERLSIEAWYLHKDQDEKYYFKDTQNLVAKLNGLVTSYTIDQAKKELREQLKFLFQPSMADCYQVMLPLPALDEIQLLVDKVTLVILEPKEKGLDPAVDRFWQQTDYRNRVAFLTGAANTFSRLVEAGKRTKAIQHILDEFATERRLANDPQLLQANDLRDRYKQNFYSAVRETFTSLYYPVKVPGAGEELENREILMRFENNRYDGEQQITDLLKAAGKFETDIDSPIFRQKVEARLFTQTSMQWSEIKRRAANNPAWQWHKPNALDGLKNRLLNEDQWRENGGYIEKGPFEAPAPSVHIREIERDTATGKVRLEVRKMNGDHVYYEFGAVASTGSLELTSGTLETDKLIVSFLCVDSARPDTHGEPVQWKNRIEINHQFYNTGQQQMCKLVAVPKGVIKYTTDGSSPIANGGVYNQPFAVPAGALMVLAVAEAEGIQSETVRLNIPRIGTGPDAPEATIDPDRSARWRKTIRREDTAGVYQLLQDLQAISARVSVASLLVSNGSNFAELTLDQNADHDPSQILAALESMRPLVDDATITIEVTSTQFLFGRDLTNWAKQRQLNVVPQDVRQ